MQRIDKIDQIDYQNFIFQWFQLSGKSISVEIINDLLEWSCLHTYYVQLICNRVFVTDQQQITPAIWKEEAYTLLKEQETFFFNYRNILTPPQWNLLIAVAHEGIVNAPTSKDFIEKYKLGSPSTVLRSLNSLINSELIYSSFDKNGKVFYSLYDILLHRWTELFPLR
jgi:DNA-binding MarR family transcriptional regulator